MTLPEVLAILDDQPDPVQRLIGLDWLNEQGYEAEFRFYKWFFEKGLQPFHYKQAWPPENWQWFRWPQNGLYVNPQVKNALIGDRRVWLTMPLRRFATKRESIAALRAAYIKGVLLTNRNQHTYSNLMKTKINGWTEKLRFGWRLLVRKKGRSPCGCCKHTPAAE